MQIEATKEMGDNAGIANEGIKHVDYPQSAFYPTCSLTWSRAPSLTPQKLLDIQKGPITAQVFGAIS